MLFPLLVGSPALAKDQTGRPGLGADASFTGGPAAQFTYYTSPKLGVQGTLGLNIFSANNGGSTTALTVGGGIVYKLVEGDDVDLGFQLAASYAFIDASLLRIAPGIRPELFLTDDLSLHASVGLTVTVVGADSANFGLVQGTTIALGGTGLLGGAGFTFYF